MPLPPAGVGLFILYDFHALAGHFTADPALWPIYFVSIAQIHWAYAMISFLLHADMLYYL
jgi:hypothetical protein